jgi:hypothetical protein
MLLLKTIVLLGAFQGLIVSGLLRASGRRHPGQAVSGDRHSEEAVSRRLLAAFIFWIALACLNIYLLHEPFWTDTMTGRILGAVVPLIVVMPLGPLIYFYVRSCEEPDFRLTRRYRPHFYPVIVDPREHHAIFVQFPATLQAGSIDSFQVRYSGEPLEPDFSILRIIRSAARTACH